MRTVIGPFCANCRTEMVRLSESNSFGYIHGRWAHITEPEDCPRPDVTWELAK